MHETIKNWLSQCLPPPLALFEKDLHCAVEASIEGGKEAMRFYKKKSLEVSEKGKNDPVTNADFAANQAILTVLSRYFPKDLIRSEESPPLENEEMNGRLWVVDPLDGTKDFIAENSEFSVMIGLSFQGRCQLGAVYRPDPGVLFFGISDQAAWSVSYPGKNEKVHRLDLSQEKAGDPIRFVRSRSHPNQKLIELEKELKQVKTMKVGSVGIKCSLIANSNADLYVHPVPFLKEWDTCAPEAILRGAGGRLTDCFGKELTYGKANPQQREGIFAAHPHIWRKVEETVKRIGVTPP